MIHVKQRRETLCVASKNATQATFHAPRWRREAFKLFCCCSRLSKTAFQSRKSARNSNYRGYNVKKVELQHRSHEKCEIGKQEVSEFDANIRKHFLNRNMYISQSCFPHRKKKKRIWIFWSLEASCSRWCSSSSVLGLLGRVHCTGIQNGPIFWGK